MKSNNFGTLFLVSTPIGNLKDITLRAIETLSNVDIIVCENPSSSLKLLNALNIKNKKLIQLNAIIERKNTSNIISILKQGKNIAYISDAGTPLISDPGNILVNDCINNEINISPIPGANAILPALIGSGINSDDFTFIGFLSNKKSAKTKQIKQLLQYKNTIIFYESSHRINETLEILKEVFPKDNRICIARELTKLHEEYIRDTISNITLSDEQSKGEFVIVLEAANLENQSSETLSDEDILNKLKDLITNNKLSKKEAIKQISKENNISKNKVYSISLKI